MNPGTVQGLQLVETLASMVDRLVTTSLQFQKGRFLREHLINDYQGLADEDRVPIRHGPPLYSPHGRCITQYR